MKFEMRKNILKKIVPLVLLVGAIPLFSSAQGFFPFQTGLQTGPSINLNINPENPGPYEEVVITAQGSSMNLPQTYFSWYKGGVLQKEGQAENIFRFETGAIGNTATIKVIADTGTFVVEKSTVITPGTIDILWEADTYTPPFYRGKALPTSNARLTLTAIPHSESGFGNAMVYHWYQDYTKNYGVSGYGQKSVEISAEYAGQNIIKVIATAEGTSAIESEQVEIEIHEPKIVFYPKNDTVGTAYAHALGNSSTVDGETLELVAEPYFFSFEDNVNNPGRYVWELNNDEITLTGEKSSLLLRLPEGASGRANISLQVQNQEKLLQQAEKDISLIF